MIISLDIIMDKRSLLDTWLEIIKLDSVVYNWGDK